MLKKKIAFLAVFTFMVNLVGAIEGDATFCYVADLVENKSYCEALHVIDHYRYECGEDVFFEAMLGLVAACIDEETLCSLVNKQTAEYWSSLFYKFAQKKNKDSLILQKKSEGLARMLLTKEPCNPDHFTLFAKSASTFANVPPVDYIAIRRAHGNILSLDFNCESLGDMAYAAYLANWIDYSSFLYQQYFNACCGTVDHTLFFSKVLEREYNITCALRMIEFYGQCVNYNTTYWKTLANILNGGNFAETAYPILVKQLEEDPDDFMNWAIYAQTAATLNYRCESLYGLKQAELRKPADIETEWAQWMALPPVMSKVNVYGSHYHESTTLANIVEGANYYASQDPYTKYIVGFETFQTSARPKFLFIGGLGRLSGPNGQENAEVETGWVGCEKLVHPKFLGNLRLGASRMYISTVGEKWTPAFYLDLDSRQSDYLNLHLFSSYSYYQVSPRASAFQIRRWRNELTIDYRPNYDTQFLATIDGRALTDGNRQLECFFFPRRTFLYLEHWKITGGLLGNWLTTKKDPLHGYYAPHLYQVYAGQVIAEYRVNMHSTIRAFGSLGTQKDNFSTFFGPYTQATLDCLYSFSLNWQLRLLGDYYFVKQSSGSFNYMKFFGELTYRF